MKKTNYTNERIKIDGDSGRGTAVAADWNALAKLFKVDDYADEIRNPKPNEHTVFKAKANRLRNAFKHFDSEKVCFTARHSSPSDTNIFYVVKPEHPNVIYIMELADLERLCVSEAERGRSVLNLRSGDWENENGKVGNMVTTVQSIFTPNGLTPTHGMGFKDCYYDNAGQGGIALATIKNDDLSNGRGRYDVKFKGTYALANTVRQKLAKAQSLENK